MLEWFENMYMLAKKYSSWNLKSAHKLLFTYVLRRTLYGTILKLNKQKLNNECYMVALNCVEFHFHFHAHTTRYNNKIFRKFHKRKYNI